MIDRKIQAWVYAFLLLLGTLALGYYIPRTSFGSILAVFSACFILYWRLFVISSTGASWKKLVLLAILLRLTLLFSIPQWSEDYARFLWDGNLLVEGLNPYFLTPTAALQQLDLESSLWVDQLFPLLNSPDYHSIYPPSNQVVFGLAAFLSKGDVLYGVMMIRFVLFVFELLAFYLIYLLLQLFHQPAHKLLLYALNPLVIMEITGNLHFEGIMLTMILAGIYFLKKNNFIYSGGIMAAAVAVKLSPLMLFPAVFRSIPIKAWLGFSLAAVFVLLLTLNPLFWNVEGFGQSLSLYGNVFEFNASVYYLLRQAGYWISGYNIISTLGPFLKGLTLVLILIVSFRSRNKEEEAFPETLLLVYWTFFLLSTVVHPWYIVPAIGISVLTEKRAFIIWSFLIVFSYQTYQSQPYTESTLLLFLQYVCLMMALWKDRWYKNFSTVKSARTSSASKQKTDSL